MSVKYLILFTLKELIPTNDSNVVCLSHASLKSCSACGGERSYQQAYSCLDYGWLIFIVFLSYRIKRCL